MPTKKLQRNKKLKTIKLDEFYYHELLDRTSMMQQFVEMMLYEHPAVVQNPKYKKLVEKVQSSLGGLYQTVGAEHL